MPPTATAELLQVLQGAIVISTSYGIVSQHDGSYVAGTSEGTFDFPPSATGRWYRSTNNGLTWSSIGTSEAFNALIAAFPTNIHSNIIVIGAEEPASQTALIQRSTNSGASWSTVYSATPAATPNGRLPFIAGVQSFNKTHAIAWGQLDGDFSNPPMLYALSNNAGATFSPAASFDIGDGFDLATACGIAEDGTIFLQYTKNGGVNRTSNFARSDNGGSTWTTLGSPPGGDGTPPNVASAICCFSKTTLAMVGQLNLVPNESAPGVWWSDDAGASLNLLSASDIADWPSGDFVTRCDEIKRLTRDACILSLDQQNGTPGSPWRISIDQGHTYPIAVTFPSGSWKTYQSPAGKIVVTRTGKILAPLNQSDDFSSWSLAIYGITLHC